MISRPVSLLILSGLAISAASFGQEPTSPVKSRPAPCENIPEFSQFDFWEGKWEVHTAAKKKAGDNTIRKMKGSCVLVERWTSVNGGTGISLNYYDPDAKQWVQNWVDGSGSIIDIRGGIKDGSMVLVGTIQYVGKDRVRAFRGTWTSMKDGRVRQFFEESADSGKTWKTWFEGFYSRHDEQPAS